MDVDGVLTDGTITISSDGTESKRFSILDGMGLMRLKHAGITVAWISGRLSAATTLRGNELKVPHIIQGRIDKATELRELASRLGLQSEECVYMGDDDIDAAAISWAGIGAAPSCSMPAAPRRGRLHPGPRGRARRGPRGSASRSCAPRARTLVPTDNRELREMIRSVRSTFLALGLLLAGAVPASSADMVIAPAVRNWGEALFSDKGYHTMTLSGLEMRPISKGPGRCG